MDYCSSLSVLAVFTQPLAVTVVCSKVFKQTSSVVLFIFIGLVRLRSGRIFRMIKIRGD